MKASLFILCAVLAVIQAVDYTYTNLNSVKLDDDKHETETHSDDNHETETHSDDNHETETSEDDHHEKETYEKESEPLENYPPTVIKPKIKIYYNQKYKNTKSDTKKKNEAVEKRQKNKPKTEIEYNGVRRKVKKQGRQIGCEAEKKLKLAESVNTAKPACDCGCTCGGCKCGVYKLGAKGYDGADGGNVGYGVNGGKFGNVVSKYNRNLMNPQNNYYNNQLARRNRLNRPDYNRFGETGGYYVGPESSYRSRGFPSKSWVFDSLNKRSYY